MVLVPLVLGLIQVGLVMHVRNTLAAAATEGARYGANIDRSPADGAARTREQVRGAVADRFAQDVSASRRRSVVSRRWWFGSGPSYLPWGCGVPESASR